MIEMCKSKAQDHRHDCDNLCIRKIGHFIYSQSSLIRLLLSRIVPTVIGINKIRMTVRKE